MATHDDREIDLVMLAAAGEHDAFDRLFQLYGEFVQHTAIGFSLPGDPFTSDDVTQEVWTSLLDGQWRPDPDKARASLHAFVYAIVKFMVWRLRQAAHPTIRFVSTERPIVSAIAAIHRDPIGRMVNDEQATVLRWAVAALPQRDRTLLTLRYRDGLSCRAIAERQGRAMQTIAEHLVRIHRRLAERCGVQPIPVRRGRYARDVAFTTEYGLAARARKRANTTKKGENDAALTATGTI